MRRNRIRVDGYPLTALAAAMMMAMMLMPFAGAAVAGEDPEVAFGVDLYSAYVWRGITFNDGLAAQPSLDVTIGGFNFNVWGNFDIDDYDNSLDDGEFSEIDLTLSYTVEAGPLSVTGGYIEYLFPTTDAGGAPGTREIFVDLSGEPADGFVLGATAYYDIDEVEDYYLTPYVGYSLAINDEVSLDFGASCGYAGEDFALGGESGFHEYTVYLGAGYQMEAVSFSALLGYTDTMDKDVLPEAAADVNFFGGVGISYSF